MNMLAEAAVEDAINRDSARTETVKMQASGVNVFYGEKQALFDVDLAVRKNQVTALIGPSGCGKSTFLRCLNRMNDTIDICRVTGSITLDGEDIYDPKIDVVELRARVGMVFQKPNPFPKSIYENVAYGLRIQGINDRRVLDEAVERALRGALAREADPEAAERIRAALEAIGPLGQAGTSGTGDAGIAGTSEMPETSIKPLPPDGGIREVQE